MEPAAAGAKYPLALRILHWLIALLIIGMLCVGLYMTGLPRGDENRTTLYLLHKSFGVTVLMLAALRLFVRLKEGVPPLPLVIPPIERLLAHAGHWMLYGFMALMPISGMLMSNSYGLPVKWFGVTLPRLIGMDIDRGHMLADFHRYGAYALIGLICVHVFAVLVHYLRQRLNLLKRMI